MERTEVYWLWLSLKKINNRKTIKLLEHFGTIEAVFAAGKEELTAINIFTPKEVALLLDKDLSAAEAELEMCDMCGIRLLTFSDPSYPSCLRALSDAPLLFYTMGDWSLLAAEPKLTVVGPRESDNYGNETAFHYSKELASAGVVIVSGMAKGVDGHAHAGALRGRGKTIAILGCGIDMDYPRENLELKKEIAEKGLILSEFPLGTEAYGRNFPFRNRVLSALSGSVLVAQAGKRSGALITAHCAIDQGKEVFAIPGNVDSLLSEGVNRMIRDGEATMALSPMDILSQLHPQKKPVFTPVVPEAAMKKAEEKTAPLSGETKEKKRGGTPEEQTVLDALQVEMDIDRLGRALGIPIGELSSRLTLMEMSGLVEKLPGKRYRKK